MTRDSPARCGRFKHLATPVTYGRRLLFNRGGRSFGCLSPHFLERPGGSAGDLGSLITMAGDHVFGVRSDISNPERLLALVTPSPVLQRQLTRSSDATALGNPAFH